MKRNLVLLGICLLAVSFVGEAFGQKKKPRIGIILAVMTIVTLKMR